MNKKNLALNNLHWLICLKTKPNQTRRSVPYQHIMSVYIKGKRGALVC